MSKSARAVRFDEINGKTVSGCGHDGDRMIVAFTDGTVMALTAMDDGCDLCDQERRPMTDLDFAPALEPGETLLYCERVPEAERSSPNYYDTPEAVAVVDVRPRADTCIIYGMYHGVWHANSSARWLVERLLKLNRELARKCGCLERHLQNMIDV